MAVDDSGFSWSRGDRHPTTHAERHARVLQRVLLDQDVRAAGRADLHVHDPTYGLDGRRIARRSGDEQAHRLRVDPVVDWRRGGSVTPDRSVYLGVAIS